MFRRLYREMESSYGKTKDILLPCNYARVTLVKVIISKIAYKRFITTKNVHFLRTIHQNYEIISFQLTKGVKNGNQYNFRIHQRFNILKFLFCSQQECFWKNLQQKFEFSLLIYAERQKKCVKYFFRLQKVVKNQNPIIPKNSRPETWVVFICRIFRT